MVLSASYFQSIRFHSALAILILMIGWGTGCGTPKEIRPEGDEASAKAALEAALHAWKSGSSPTEIAAPGTVFWTDEDWQAGQKLADYQVVDQAESNGGHWRVYANLTIQSNASQKKPTRTRVCYAVTLGEPTSIIRSDFLN
jgi:hypothetical protein